MTFTTELSILESQSQKIIYLNNTLEEALAKTAQEALDLGLCFNLSDSNSKRLLLHNIILQICELKKTIPCDCLMAIDKNAYDDLFLKVVNEVVERMELNKREKSLNFFKTFRKYLKQNGLLYLSNVYLKQVNNKLALFR